MPVARAIEALIADMETEEIKALEQALFVLTPDQQKNMKALFRKVTFTRIVTMGPEGMMMERDMMKPSSR